MTLQTDLLKGKLVYLDAIKKDDLAIHLPFANDIDTHRLSREGVFRPMTIEREEKWYESLYKGDTFIPFAIRLIETSRYIGEISIAAVNWQARHCWVGIVIGNTQHRGKGYGTDAMRVLLRYAFMEMNMNRVGLGVFGYNKQAVKSYEKVGFKHEGVARQAVWRDGRFYDDITMSILRDEWQQG